MKDSIIGVDPATMKVMLIAEDSPAERREAFEHGWDVMSVDRAQAAEMFGETILSYQFEMET